MNRRGGAGSAERPLDLAALGVTQGGYVMAAQAKRAGYSRRTLHYSCRQGLLLRVPRGAYRVPVAPEPPFGDVVLARLVAHPEHATSQARDSCDFRMGSATPLPYMVAR